MNNKRLRLLLTMGLLCISLRTIIYGSEKMATPSSCDTETIYLSGRGCDDMVEWDFYCTDGRNSGKWSSIGVPSCWELQGYGTYQYGYEYNKWNKNPSTAPIASEQGHYRYAFRLPENWKGRKIDIVFEASMTDTDVKVNGRAAGETHQGGFSPFRYDISDMVGFGDEENILEVAVSKESSDPDMNLAERRCDYWNFGGIIRPVYLESRPGSNIERVAIDADMNGMLKADCFLDGIKKGMELKVAVYDKDGAVLSQDSYPLEGDSIRVSLDCGQPSLWTAETPELYFADFTLVDKDGSPLHHHKERFGFRTVELRKGDGLFINGRRVKMKGVNRHSFRPESGRTLSYRKNLEDALLIKELNMNAVRLSHYPADKEFYDICDSLGLYVIDELTGWQHPQKTEIGRRLVRELVTRDVNHPSVIMWASGNEGGFNYDLEPDFQRYDIQNRLVIYPWSIHEGINTRHYRSWAEMKKYLEGPDVVMPTEFLHGLYDGGLGAGLDDYWTLMKDNPRSAGGFLWALYDEGVVRTDMDGRVDTKECYGPDGIVGPHGEKEGSFHAVRQIWSPIQLRFISADSVVVENRYDFLGLAGSRLRCRYLGMPGTNDCSEKILEEKTISLPDIQPGGSHSINLGPPTADSDCMEISAIDGDNRELFTWRHRLESKGIDRRLPAAGLKATDHGDVLEIAVGGRKYAFSKSDGMLAGVEVEGRKLPFGGGPRLIAARRGDRNPDSLTRLDRKLALSTTDYLTWPDSLRVTSMNLSDSTLTVDYSGGHIRRTEWKFLADGSVRIGYDIDFDGVVDIFGVTFDLPESSVVSKRWVGKGPYRVWQNRMQGPQFGYWETGYNDPIPGETFEYPEFKGYFADVAWMEISVGTGRIILDELPESSYVGVFTPRDGRDSYLYRLPESGISILRHIPAVRNKVDYSDLNGPSAQPHKLSGTYSGFVILKFE